MSNEQPKQATKVIVVSHSTPTTINNDHHQGATKFVVDSEGQLWVNNTDNTNVAVYAHGRWDSARLSTD